MLLALSTENNIYDSFRQSFNILIIIIIHKIIIQGSCYLKTKKRVLAYLLTLTLAMTSLPTQLFAQDTINTPVPISALVDTQTTTPGAIQINPNKYVGDGYEVEFKVINQWPGAFQGEFVLTNTSNQPLENWTLKYDFEHEITNMWNAQIVTHEAYSYIIKNQGYNQDIAPGSSVNIGFQANWNDEIKAPESYDLLIAKQEVGDTDYTIDFKVTGDWGQAFNGEISITNNTEETIEDWTLEFDFDRNIERFWTAEIVEHEGEHYVIKNVGYNANIAPGQTITLGFSGNPGNVDSKPTDYHLYKVVNIQSKVDKKSPIITVDTSKLQYDEGMGAYIIDQKLNALNGVIADDSAISSISYKISSSNLELKSTNIIPSKEWSIENIPLLIGKNSITIIAKDSSSNIGTTTLTLFNLSAENMEGIQFDQADDDSDGLLNYQEIYYNTDPLKPDTDGDGLNDYQELVITNTDPLKVDTDSNGITDDQEDFDQDSVKNIDELKLNGNPYGKDTDFDDLVDGQEIIKGTKLDEYDTDNDKLSDSKEIEIGTDPLNPDTDGDGILDGDEEFSVTKTVPTEDADPNVVPTIDMEIPGNLIETLHISKLPEDDLYLPKEIPGYLGAGYEFELGDTFDKPATLTYKFNPEFLNKEGFNPAIYYCDTENQEMVLLENQTIDLVNCTVSVTITHFSKYILIDKTQFDKAFEEDEEDSVLREPIMLGIGIDVSNNVEGFIDDSKSTAKEIMNLLFADDWKGILSYSQNVGVSLVTKDLTTSLLKIDSIVPLDQENVSLSYGLNMTLGLVGANYAQIMSLDSEDINSSNSEKSSMLKSTPARYIIIFTDGNGSYSPFYTGWAEYQGVKVYTVGIGNNVNEQQLRTISQGTGGEYFHISNRSELISALTKILGKNIDKVTDTDNDDLSDYYEERLRWFNGVTIKTDPNNPDTDGDGLLDGEEVSAVVDKKNNVHHYIMYSNPTLTDTDGDDLLDSKISLKNKENTISLLNNSDGDWIPNPTDPEPLVYNITDRTLGLVAGFAYSDVEKYKQKKISEILSEATLDGIGTDIVEIQDFRIIDSNDSGTGKIGDSEGLGFVAIQLIRDNKKSTRRNVIILAFRGTEFDDDVLNDTFSNATGILASKYLSQSNNAYKFYKSLVKKYPNNDFYLTGHSMGGRITQDVLMQIYENNTSMFKTDIKEPYKSATFNGYGYRQGNNHLEGDNFIEANKLGKMKEYYKYGRLYNYTMKGDVVGEYLGPIKLGTNKDSFIAHDENGIIDISNEETIYGKGTSYANVHGIPLFHRNKDFFYKGKDSKINIYEVQFIESNN